MMPDHDEDSAEDVVARLEFLAEWVSAKADGAPELQIFRQAASEIGRLRSRLERISRLAQSEHFVLEGV